MSKYIIKNCDCILSSGRCNVKSLVFCQDCTDCKMKQIVDYCLYNGKYGDAYYTNPILKLLDMQEIE